MEPGVLNWIRATQLGEDALHYRGKGNGVVDALRTAWTNLLNLRGFRPNRMEQQAVMHTVTALLAMAQRQLKPISVQHFESAVCMYRL